MEGQHLGTEFFKKL